MTIHRKLGVVNKMPPGLASVLEKSEYSQIVATWSSLSAAGPSQRMPGCFSRLLNLAKTDGVETETCLSISTLLLFPSGFVLDCKVLSFSYNLKWTMICQKVSQTFRKVRLKRNTILACNFFDVFRSSFFLMGGSDSQSCISQLDHKVGLRVEIMY